MGKKLASRDEGAVTLRIEDRVTMAMTALRPGRRAAVRKVLRQLRAGTPVDSRPLPKGREEAVDVAPDMVLMFRRQGTTVSVTDLLNKDAFTFLTGA